MSDRIILMKNDNCGELKGIVKTNADSIGIFAPEKYVTRGEGYT